MSNLRDKLMLTGKLSEAWDAPSTVYNDEAGTVTVDTNEITSTLNEMLYSNQRLQMTRMRGWGLTSESGIDVYTSPQKLAELKASEETKENSDMLARLKRDLPSDASSLWKTEAATREMSGEVGVYLDLQEHAGQAYITDRVFRDLDYLRKAGWTTNVCRTGALWVHVTPPVEQPTYATAKAALSAEFNGEDWVNFGMENSRGEVYFHADRMSEMDFNRAVQACQTMAGKRGWRGSRLMRAFLQPLTGKTEFDRVAFVAPERVMQDA